MAEIALLDQAYHFTMQRFVSTGQAPHYTNLASGLGLAMEEGKQLLHDLVHSGIPAWLHPQTDYLVSFAPFHSLPTQYRTSVDGRSSGLPSEASRRWRYAGCFPVRRYAWMPHVWTAASTW